MLSMLLGEGGEEIINLIWPKRVKAHLIFMGVLKVYLFTQ